MSFFDATNNIGNPQNKTGHIIQFMHVPTKRRSFFKAFITAWDDQFKQDWKEYPTIGRMDSIRIYSRTSRVISFSIDIPSSNFKEALESLSNVESLIQMSYPTFKDEDIRLPNQASTSGDTRNSGGPAGAQDANNTAAVTSNSKRTSTISRMISPPFFKLKFANWANYSSATDSNTVENSGLYGTIDTVRFTPDLSADAGGFYSSNDFNNTSDDSEAIKPENVLIPKLLKLDILFTVLHTNPLGYDSESGKPRTAAATPNQSFPYNANSLRNKKYKVIE